MRFDHLKSLCFAGILFIILLAGGFILSEHKLLWLDELYTQHTAIENGTYGDILALRFPDGNKNPLFYLIQKVVCGLFSLHMPAVDMQIFYQTRNIPAQVILRIPSNIYMSLALSLIFYFFTRYYSVFAAFYALSVALAAPMVWMYWVEARPYSLWFLLTTIQLLLLGAAFIAPGFKGTKRLVMTHVLLALTTPASILQILIVSLIFSQNKRTGFQLLGWILALPLGIALFYYFFDHIVKIRTYMFITNLFDVIMPEHLFIYAVYALGVWVLPQKYKKISLNAFFLPVFLSLLACGIFVLALDVFTKNSAQGFFSRYLIYLTPADILMFSLASLDMFRWSRPNPWLCMNVSLVLGGLVIIRGLMTYRDILASALYLHSI